MSPGGGRGSSAWVAVAVSFAALVMAAYLAPPVRSGQTDFLSFYAGARLAGTPELYSYASANRIQRDYSNPEEVRAFIRPPFYAALVWPLGRLPYRAAQGVWQALNLAALAVFIYLWCPKPAAAVLCCWFFPTWMNYALAQDVPLVLLAFAGAARLVQSGRPVAGGLVFSLCSMKPHLFLLAPLLIVSRRMWRFAAGLALGGLVLIGISFLVAGPGWPGAYIELLRINERNQASAANMPNLLGLFAGHAVPYARVWVAACWAGIAAMVWRGFSKAPEQAAWGLLPAAGVLLGFHAFIYDCMFLLPSLALEAGMAKRPGPPLAVFAGIGLVSLFLTAPSASWVAQLTVALAVIAVTGRSVRRGRTADEPRA